MFIVTGCWTLEVGGSDGEHCLMATNGSERGYGEAIEFISSAAGTGDQNLSPEHFNWWGWWDQPYYHPKDH